MYQLDRAERSIPFAQRRPSPRVRFPMLVWHIGFWNPISFYTTKSCGTEHPVNHSDTQLARAREARFDNCRRFVNAVENRLRSLAKRKLITRHTKEDFRSLDIAEASRDLEDDLAIFSFRWHAFEVTVRIEVQQESFTVATFLDLAYEKNERYGVKCPAYCSDVVNAFDSLNEIIGAKSEESSDKIPHLSKILFKNIWNSYHNQILDYKGIIKSTETDSFKLSSEQFINARGVILGDAHEAEGSPIPPESPIVSPQKPFWYPGKRRPPDQRAKPDLERNPTFWQDRFRALWPLTTARIDNFDVSKYEFTASEVDGSCLYLTALGAQPRRLGSRPPVPLYYTLFTSAMGGWSIGRLLVLLHDLGTLRLSAIQDIDKLHKASEYLREAEIAIQQAFDRHHDQSDSKAARRELHSQLYKDLAWIRRLMSKADGEVPGGIAHRIQQSQHYIRRFDKLLAALRAEGHGDLQSYPNFVITRLGSAFSYVEMLAARQEALIRDVRTLDERSLAEEARVRNGEIERIQKSAELLTISFLVPYYVGMVASHIIWQNPERSPQAFWIVGFAVCVFLAVWHAKPTRRRTGIVRWLMLGALAFAFMVPAGIIAFGLIRSPTTVTTWLAAAFQPVERENGTKADGKDTGPASRPTGAFGQANPDKTGSIPPRRR